MPFRLVLCLLVLTLATGPAARADDLEIVPGESTYDNGSGFVMLTGEIRNHSQAWVCTPRITVRLFDADHQPIAVDSVVTASRAEGGRDAVDGALAQRTWLPPGEIAVFEYLRDRSKLAGEPVSHQLAVEGHACPDDHPTVALEEFEAQRADDGWYQAHGSIKVTGTTACRSPRVVLGLYRADGRLYRAKQVTPNQAFKKTVEPIGSVWFEIDAIENPGGDTIAEVKAWADCDWGG